MNNAAYIAVCGTGKGCQGRALSALDCSCCVHSCCVRKIESLNFLSVQFKVFQIFWKIGIGTAVTENKLWESL